MNLRLRRTMAAAVVVGIVAALVLFVGSEEHALSETVRWVLRAMILVVLFGAEAVYLGRSPARQRPAGPETRPE